MSAFWETIYKIIIAAALMILIMIVIAVVTKDKECRLVDQTETHNVRITVEVCK